MGLRWRRLNWRVNQTPSRRTWLRAIANLHCLTAMILWQCTEPTRHRLDDHPTTTTLCWLLQCFVSRRYNAVLHAQQILHSTMYLIYTLCEFFNDTVPEGPHILDLLCVLDSVWFCFQFCVSCSGNWTGKKVGSGRRSFVFSMYCNVRLIYEVLMRILSIEMSFCNKTECVVICRILAWFSHSTRELFWVVLSNTHVTNR